jgi:hypothetical protein
MEEEEEPPLAPRADDATATQRASVDDVPFESWGILSSSLESNDDVLAQMESRFISGRREDGTAAPPPPPTRTTPRPSATIATAAEAVRGGMASLPGVEAVAVDAVAAVVEEAEAAEEEEAAAGWLVGREASLTNRERVALGKGCHSRSHSLPSRVSGCLHGWTPYRLSIQGSHRLASAGVFDHTPYLAHHSTPTTWTCRIPSCKIK